jgi:hypothetical protein
MNEYQDLTPFSDLQRLENECSGPETLSVSS